MISSMPLVALVDPVHDVAKSVTSQQQHVHDGDWPQIRCLVAYDVLRHKRKGLQILRPCPELVLKCRANGCQKGQCASWQKNRQQVTRVRCFIICAAQHME